MKTFRMIGSLAFVLGLFTTIFAGMQNKLLIC